MKVVVREWRAVGLILNTMLFAVCFSVNAQQPKKVPRIGYINVASPSVVSARLEAFQQGLRELGYVEGKTVVIVHRYAEGNLDKLPDLVAELIRLKMDIILSAGAEVTRAAKEATRTIPIVMASDNDRWKRVRCQSCPTERKRYRPIYGFP
jgi:putative ABC transport system substrate-binding protein